MTVQSIRTSGARYAARAHRHRERPWGAAARTERAGTPAVTLVLMASLFVATLLSTSTFNPLLVSKEQAGHLFQALIVGLWLLMIFASLFVRRTAAVRIWPDTLLLLTFYAVACISIFGAGLAPDSVLKAFALAVTVFGAYRVAQCLSLEEIVGSVAWAFMTLAVVSLALVVAVPDIGVDQGWMHGGQWKGVFASKQTLGFMSSFLIFFALWRGHAGNGWWGSTAMILVALAALIGSGSKGAAALAVFVVLLFYLSRRSRGFSGFSVFLPFAMLCLAGVLIIYLIATQNEYVSFFGYETDFTERAVIWQYALQHYLDHPILGFGLNGFWTQPEIARGFERTRGWVLDNYHSGYVTILVETGLVGFTLFSVSFLLFGFRMNAVLRQERVSRLAFTLIAVFTALMFVVDFTETMFLRSTSIFSVLLLIVLFKSCQLSVTKPPARRAHA